MMLTCASVNGVPCAGIDGCSRPATRRYSRLSSALPGTMSDPRVPPRSALSLVLRSSVPIRMVSPWHERQLVSRMGSMSFEKETRAASEGCEAGELSVADEGGDDCPEEAGPTEETWPPGRAAARLTTTNASAIDMKRRRIDDTLM